MFQSHVLSMERIERKVSSQWLGSPWCCVVHVCINMWDTNLFTFVASCARSSIISGRVLTALSQCLLSWRDKLIPQRTSKEMEKTNVKSVLDEYICIYVKTFHWRTLINNWIIFMSKSLSIYLHYMQDWAAPTSPLNLLARKPPSNS